MTKTAIIYARVSTAGQAEDELPIDSQLETCRRKAAELQASVLREFVDAGISGRTIDHRPAFKEAIAFCRVNQVDYFVCWNTARFARNRIDAPFHKVQLKKHGTQMIYASLNVDNSTKEGWMLEGMLELVDEYYSRQVSDDTSRSMMKNARDGFFNGGNLPYGYRAVADGKRKRLEICEDEACIVREIFRHCIAGAGAKSIALALNQRGQYRRGRPWTKATISWLLGNWAYMGFVTFNRRAHDQTRRDPSLWIRTRSHAAIIEEDAFMKVQSIVAARAPRESGGSHKSTHLFTGMLKCGRCGRTMMVETATGRSARYSYYNCSGNIKGFGCPPRRIPTDEFDTWLADYVIDQVLRLDNLRAIAAEIHRETGDWIKERARKRESMVTELRDVERRRRRLYELMETSAGESLNLGDVKPRLLELNARARTLETSLAQLELQDPPEVKIDEIDLQEVRDFVRDVVVQSNDRKKARTFLSTFIEEVVVAENEARITYRKDRLVTIPPERAVHSEGGWLPEQALLRTGRLVASLPQRFRKVA